ncbi:MAG: type II secretion system GspH family protein [Bacteriovoracaceae bacterium]|jgi:type II secretion system protein I|nr:type II secretion system GspH family protein [Bacteriovoracaceae bacterium]
MAKRINLSQGGFTLIEVMIALTIFGVFTTAFVVSQANNVNNSIEMQKNVTLLSLCQNKMNEAILDPPKFTNLTDKEVTSKNFTQEGYKHFKYKIEYKKLELPDFSGLTGQDDESAANSGNDNLVRKAIFKKLKDNIEKILWQVKVTVENTQTKEFFELTSWVTNDKAQLDTNFGI